MHDLIQDMGREIVRQESSDDPGQRSRLWLKEDIIYVLTENAGSNSVQGIILTLSEPEEVQLTPKSFKKMKRLRLLIIHNAQCYGDHLKYLSNELRWLEWSGYPFSSMPDNFSPKKLVVFDMPSSRLKLSHPISWFKDFKCLTTLSLLSLNGNNITTIPACLHKLAKLRYFYVSYCKLLQEIPQPPPNMEIFSAEGCYSLQRYSQLISTHGDQLTSILQPEDFKCLTHMKPIDCEYITEVLDLSSCRYLYALEFAGCSRLKEFPKFVDNIDCLTRIFLEGTGIEELPSSIECITGLKHLHMSFCRNLTNIPSCIYKLQKLVVLKLNDCTKLSKFPVFSNKKRKFTSLNEGSSNTGSTSSLNLFFSLRMLNLKNCNLSEVNFLMNTGHFPALSFLELGGNNITTIPACLQKLAELRYLHVSNCKLLQEIPRIPEDRGQIEAYRCESLQIYSQHESILRGGSNKDQFMSILRREGFANVVKMLIPGNEIPEWFSHKSSKSSISVRVPINTSITLIAVAPSAFPKSHFFLHIEIFINRGIQHDFPVYKLPVDSGNLWLCYIPQIFLSSYRGDYVDVEVKVSEPSFGNDSSDDIDLLELKALGVHLMEG
ncbi:hypothetical protein L6164_017298 [Bauhinia variegata]|uniref:Uncharacterized protein n=1 Tax=Bauhinia variegata TaxID=167791 RepID=A0ACB9N7I1_BAUVA|nr:hypothetical protein L6164_017298 [Bauhinia variegata]